MPKVVHLLDLTGAQVAQVEQATGLPIEQWSKANKGELYPLICAVAFGGDVEEYAALPMRQLLEMVVIDDTPTKGPSA